MGSCSNRGEELPNEVLREIAKKVFKTNKDERVNT